MINEKLNNIQENVLLANHTTFRIGGPARYFFEAKTKEDLIKALGWARENNIAYFILGGGSNLLVSDKGFEGLVIKIQNTKYQIQDTKIIAEAGVPLAKLVIELANNNLTGLEWAAGIPGTIGGAICGNVGAYGHSISENVTGVKAINSKGEIINFNKEDCGFYYRGSVFKDVKGFVIVEAELKLEGEENKFSSSPFAVARVVDESKDSSPPFAAARVNDENGEAEKMIKKILADRRNKIPAFPSAGSFFKNYVLKGDEGKPSSSPIAVARETEDQEKDPLIERFPEIKSQVKGGKIAAGYLIEQCGLKGKTIGGAAISEQHANFIINKGGAKSSDVLALAKICKDRVKEKFGVNLEEETRFI